MKRLIAIGLSVLIPRTWSAVFSTWCHF